MADVARQVLVIVGSGAREGSITINLLKFPGGGSPEFVVERVSKYLDSGGATILNLNRAPGTYLITFQVALTGAYNGDPFVEDYQEHLNR
jgi:hypothetical protein